MGNGLSRSEFEKMSGPGVVEEWDRSHLSEQIENLMLGLSPKGTVQPAWIDSAIDLLSKASAELRLLSEARDYWKAVAEHRAASLKIVRGYIKNCDHQPALDAIDATT